MSCSIFIRSFRTDREWLYYCLRSLKKFAVDFLETVVVIPKEDQIHFDKFDFQGAKPIYAHPLNIHGYLGQQYDKLHADSYTSAEWIMFIDSDCFATKTFIPSLFFDDHDYPQKAIQLLRHWPEVGDAQCWKEPTAKVLGFEPVFETMAAMPLVYHRDSFSLLREHIQTTLKMPLSDYLLGLSEPKFSEFNVLGNWCLRYMPYRYDWRLANPETDGYCRSIIQRFSHSPIDPYIEDYERILAS